MSRPEYVSEQESCPACGVSWRYEGDADGKMYSRLIGIYSLTGDRTVGWECPECQASWDRGAVIS